MNIKYLDKREVLEGVKITHIHSPEAIKTTRFWDMLVEKTNPKDRETILYISSLEEMYRGETHIQI